ncbi:MAG: hypothetical protein M1817_006157 [Caeruleum heppii]|nr:MAG: hypothetical protein M1817_006157 [Caeruleum heppii]
MPHFPPHLLVHLSIGNDIVHIPRIRRLLTTPNKRYIDPFVRRIFSPEEQPKVFQKVGILERGGLHRADSLAQWMAGRFAAKEAAIKAMSSRKLTWHDIIIHDDKRKPYITIRRPPWVPPSSVDGESVSTPAPASPAETDEIVAQLSISHDEEYATAVVLAIDDGDESQD